MANLWCTRQSSLCKQKKKLVLKGFREQLVFVVDLPQAGRYAITDEGNTARRSLYFFWCRFDKKASGHSINDSLQNTKSGIFLHKYGSTFCGSVALILLSTTFHKIRIYGQDIIIYIGGMSEKANEFCGVFIKRSIQNFERKCVKQKKKERCFHMLLVRLEIREFQVYEKPLKTASFVTRRSWTYFKCQ